MDNYFIADQLSLLSKLMDIHGEHSFKSKSYSIAAFTIEQLPMQLTETPPEKIFSIKGIGDSTGKKILEVIEKGELSQLKALVNKTPPGVLEMLSIKGLGPKKIAAIWKEMEIESLGELLYACNENRLLNFKGFGEKSQRTIQDAIEFYFNNQGSFLYAQTESYAQAMATKLQQAIPNQAFEITGEYKRQMEVINKLEWVTAATEEELDRFFETFGYHKQQSGNDSVSYKGSGGISLGFYITDRKNLFTRVIETSCSAEFLECLQQKKPADNIVIHSEADYFSARNLSFIPACLREKAKILDQGTIPELIQSTDIRGTIHTHSNWSDGANTIEEMARVCINLNLEYLVISDHSKSAFYAKGLTEDRIRQQHYYIDELNDKLSPFKIFKGIECDILADGALDYSDNILSTFDLVITSIHSNFKMTEEKATRRLLNAIENPYTTILGHMTGRLLLSRNGYPVDSKQIIDACARNKVVIEHNANPRRLDMDWRYMDYALEKGVLISIDPDAHAVSAFDDVKYGVLTAQKAGVTKAQNLSSFSLKDFTEYLVSRKMFRSL
jgi:DNA polymerase (family 10)